MKSLARAALLAVSVPVCIPAAIAQDYSDADLRAIFLRQMSAIRDAERNPALGASRGLTLNAVATPETAANAAPPSPTTPDDGTALTLQTAPSEPVQHWSLPTADQVNVRIVFAFDSAAIEADQRARLQQFCNVVDELGIKHFRIVGHTDAAGGEAYNQALSIRRAASVKGYFVDQCHIAPERLEAIGVGEQFLADPADPLAPVNRRVEFQALG